MNSADKYVKVVEWSEEDGCFIGSCPELFYGGCHGTDARAVFVSPLTLSGRPPLTLSGVGRRPGAIQSFKKKAGS